eukprot:1712115-Rhodomonas_salina.3
MHKRRKHIKYKEHDDTKGKQEAENKLKNEEKKKHQHSCFQIPHSNFQEILSPESLDADK